MTRVWACLEIDVRQHVSHSRISSSSLLVFSVDCNCPASISPSFSARPVIVFTVRSRAGRGHGPARGDTLPGVSQLLRTQPRTCPRAGLRALPTHRQRYDIARLSPPWDSNPLMIDGTNVKLMPNPAVARFSGPHIDIVLDRKLSDQSNLSK